MRFLPDKSSIISCDKQDFSVSFQIISAPPTNDQGFYIWIPGPLTIFHNLMQTREIEREKSRLPNNETKKMKSKRVPWLFCIFPSPANEPLPTIIREDEDKDVERDKDSVLAGNDTVFDETTESA